jgi:hypothetical protein
MKSTLRKKKRYALSLALTTAMVLGAQPLLAQNPQMKFNTSTLDAKSGKVLGVANLEGGLDALWDAQKKMVYHILEKAGVSKDSIPPEIKAKIDVPQTTSFKALVAYSEGLSNLDQGFFGEAEASLQSALKHDPSFGMAQNLLAAIPEIKMEVGAVAKVSSAEAQESADADGKAKVGGKGQPGKKGKGAGLGTPKEKDKSEKPKFGQGGNKGPKRGAEPGRDLKNKVKKARKFGHLVASVAQEIIANQQREGVVAETPSSGTGSTRSPYYDNEIKLEDNKKVLFSGYLIKQSSPTDQNGILLLAPYFTTDPLVNNNRGSIGQLSANNGTDPGRIDYYSENGVVRVIGMRDAENNASNYNLDSVEITSIPGGNEPISQEITTAGGSRESLGEWQSKYFSMTVGDSFYRINGMGLAVKATGPERLLELRSDQNTYTLSGSASVSGFIAHGNNSRAINDPDSNVSGNINFSNRDINLNICGKTGKSTNDYYVYLDFQNGSFGDDGVFKFNNATDAAIGNVDGVTQGLPASIPAGDKAGISVNVVGQVAGSDAQGVLGAGAIHRPGSGESDRWAAEITFAAGRQQEILIVNK